MVGLKRSLQRQFPARTKTINNSYAIDYYRQSSFIHMENVGMIIIVYCYSSDLKGLAGTLLPVEVVNASVEIIDTIMRKWERERE